MSEVQEEGAHDPVRSVQGDRWFGWTIPLPMPERVQSTRVALPDARQELLNQDWGALQRHPARERCLRFRSEVDGNLNRELGGWLAT